jgi:hypothetical protein
MEISTVIILALIIIIVSCVFALEWIEYRKTKRLLSKMKKDIDRMAENVKKITANHYRMKE